MSWSTIRIGPRPYIAVDHAGDGEFVLFLHGIGGNRRNWLPQLPAFSPHVLAVAWDARGYGDSDDYDGPLAFSDYADDVPRVLAHFGQTRAHIVGLSMGGRIAMDLAVRYPGLVETLTLCDTHRGFARFSDADRADFVRLRKAPLLAGAEPRDVAVPVAKSLIGPMAVPGAFEQLVDSLSRLHKASYIKSIEASVLGDTSVDLAAIDVPTHVVVGADDPLTPPAVAAEIAGAIAGARLTIIPDAGHLSNIEQPELFNAAVLGFIQEHMRAGAGDRA